MSSCNVITLNETNCTRTIANDILKSVQISAYADDIVIIGKDVSTIKLYRNMNVEVERMGFMVNEGKKKYTYDYDKW